MRIIKLIVLYTFAMATACAGPQEKTPSAGQSPNKETFRAAIQNVIDTSIARATHQAPDGSKYILDRPMVTLEEQQQVQKFGDTAVEVLSEYSSKGKALQQRPALMLLTAFKSDKALAGLVQFAEHSQIPQYAVANLCVFPPDKTLPILERFTKSANPEVQRAAKECLRSLRPLPQP